ncbi:cold-shock protein [Paenibacillus sp. NPDC057967]|uniref:cold-shock protein n=1 Tax=Paenibacillus sp. NPDC057967 TaxID=3346293 RepID=UPI0036D8C115
MKEKLFGTVKSFDLKQGFGVIRTDRGGEHVYFHASSILMTGVRCLTPGDVSFFVSKERHKGSRRRRYRHAREVFALDGP